MRLALKRARYILEAWGEWYQKPISGLSYPSQTTTSKMIESSASGFSPFQRTIKYEPHREAAKVHRLLCELNNRVLAAIKLRYCEKLRAHEAAYVLGISRHAFGHLVKEGQNHIIKKMDLDQSSLQGNIQHLVKVGKHGKDLRCTPQYRRVTTNKNPLVLPK